MNRCVCDIVPYIGKPIRRGADIRIITEIRLSRFSPGVTLYYKSSTCSKKTRFTTLAEFFNWMGSERE